MECDLGGNDRSGVKQMTMTMMVLLEVREARRPDQLSLELCLRLLGIGPACDAWEIAAWSRAADALLWARMLDFAGLELQLEQELGREPQLAPGRPFGGELLHAWRGLGVLAIRLVCDATSLLPNGVEGSVPSVADPLTVGVWPGNCPAISGHRTWSGSGAIHFGFAEAVCRTA